MHCPSINIEANLSLCSCIFVSLVLAPHFWIRRFNMRCRGGGGLAYPIPILSIVLIWCMHNNAYTGYDTVYTNTRSLIIYCFLNLFINYIRARTYYLSFCWTERKEKILCWTRPSPSTAGDTMELLKRHNNFRRHQLHIRRRQQNLFEVLHPWLVSSF